MNSNSFKTDLVSNLLQDSISNNNEELVEALESFIHKYKIEKRIRNIPVGIFSSKLGVLEATVKYLKENCNLSYAEIAKLLKRDDRTVWTSYNKANKKHKDKFLVSTSNSFDVSILANREKSPLKCVISHLKDRGMTLKQISVLLNRSYKTVWLTYRK